MLTKPVNGRCEFSLFDFEVQISCVEDIPVDWLKTCKYGLEGRLPVSFSLLDNGYEYVMLSIDGYGLSIVEVIDENRKLFQHDFSLVEFTEELLKDIEMNLDEWVNWYPAKILGGPDAGRREVLVNLLAYTKEALASYVINKP